MTSTHKNILFGLVTITLISLLSILVSQTILNQSQDLRQQAVYGDPIPSTPIPSTPVPATPVPSTPIPSTPVPSTPDPATPVPSTPVPSTPVPATPVPSTPPSASVSISQANCVNVAGKYQAGSAITFVGTGPSTNTRTVLYIAKLNAAGTGLDASFNSSCPIGTTASGSPYFCMLTQNTTNSPSTTWTPSITGKFVVVSNGHTATTSCSGNPTCTYNVGADNPMTPVTCAGNFTSCSNNDYKFFEVLPIAQCITAATPPSASVGISQANCVNAPGIAGKYQAGSAITFTGTGPSTNTKTYLFLAKLNAAGTGLDTTFNTNCPIGVKGENSSQFCKVSMTENNSPTASWSTPTAGKYVIVSNGYTATASCSGNPTCSINAGTDNPMIAGNCPPSWFSCSNNDYKFFEVVAAASCTVPVCSYNPNIDGKNGVDIDDYVLFVQNVMKVGNNIAGDVDCSGRVDLDDYPYIVRNFSIQ